MIGAYNIVLHDAQLATLEKERLAQMEELATTNSPDGGIYRYRIGRIRGLVDAMELMEEVRKKLMES